ncbi:MAG: MotA/TolQ/ExbB proton channel family protein, partial [Holophagales bacterium]|nr:MotA/TolQ/ExbB proton channel family protein [Holophagales bacterium]
VVLWRARLDFDGFGRQLRQALVDHGSVAEALEACGAASGPVARIAEAALRRFDRSPAQLDQLMERRARRELRSLNRGLGVLATIATTAPLLGFLGTVTGMMASFEILASYGISNPGMVADGIKEALTTTAAGLTVAVPMQIIYNALSGRVARITGEIEEVGNFLLEIREGLT